MSIVSESEWNTFLEHYPDAHLLQSAEWGQFKANFKWDIRRVIVGDVGAQILLRQILPGIKFAYIPKGPVGTKLEDIVFEHTSWKGIINEINDICRNEKVFFLKIEPDAWESHQPINIEKGIPLQNEIIGTPSGFQESTHAIQPQQTIVVNLENDEDQILSRMKQKTRYNIRLAGRKNIVVYPSTDIDLFFRMMKETGDRDDFEVHDRSYFQKAYDLFHPRGSCELLIADYDNQSVAGLMVFAYGVRSWYLYGASSDLHRERMPTYLLQWEAMRWAKAQGCTEYDLWGIPDEDMETLEGQFTQRRDGLWGVYRFKRGFGGELRRSIGPWDRIYNPLLYNIYRLWISLKVNL